MKKFFCSLGLIFGLMTSVYASDLDVLNSEITNILAPYQNQTTAANLQFDELEIDSVHTTKIKLHGAYSKTGSQNRLDIKIDNLSYDYNNGNAPTTIIKGSIGLDFTKFLPAEQINLMIPKAIEFLDDAVKRFSTELGDAIVIKGVVTSTSKDDEGNYTGLTALISLKIDLNQLPDEYDRHNVLLTEGIYSVSLNVKTGLTLDSFIVSNPEYWRFQDNIQGLKEMLGALLTGDEQGKDFIAGFFDAFELLASEIVERNNSN